ncbi:MAG TPA: NADH-quinone oxidoreductase subunit J [Herpetosiphonaceae bacterium]|nr:NADH-quinone oxidoreductase subunit J [Herpetosiphonaceae bacterium]
MEIVIFITTALVAVGAALGMVLSRNAVHSALFLILNFCGVAVLYLLLRAPFLAAVQVTVYAGAIMVLFLFVIMLLGVENVDVGKEPFGWQKPVAALLGLVLLAEGGYVVYRGVALTEVPISPAVAEIGAPTNLSAVLFSKYLLPFEVISILLLIAIVGTVVLTRRDQARTAELIEETKA